MMQTYTLVYRAKDRRQVKAVRFEAEDAQAAIDKVQHESVDGDTELWEGRTRKGFVERMNDGNAKLRT